MTKECIYRENGNELFIGDEITLLEPKNDPMFYNSTIGKFFKEKRCDRALMKVKQRRWLEVYFELTLFLGDKQLRDIDVLKDEDEIARYNALDLSNPSDKELHDHYNAPYVEEGGYTFMRYLLKKGATIARS